MIRQLSILILIAATAFTGCRNQKPVSTADVAQQRAPDSEIVSNRTPLKTRLGSAANTFTKDSVMLSFTVINESDTVQRFCKWETPFEPGIGKYMDLTDARGTEPPFIGAMARRVMPPPPESYITIPPHDSIRTVFNLADNYSIEPGQYTVKYSGGGISGLDAGNEIDISVTDQ